MLNFFKNMTRNNKLLLAAGSVAMLGSAAFMLYRQRNQQQLTPFHPTSGHWIGTQPVLPEHLNADFSSKQQDAMASYLTNTHMNMQHHDLDHFQRRALAFHEWSDAETSILASTRKSLSDIHSPHFGMSSHMIHNERRILSDRADHLRLTQSETANSTLSAEVKRMTGERSQGQGNDYLNLTEMLIQGKQGPLTLGQSTLGIEATIVGHHVLDKTAQYGKNNPRMQAQRPLDPLSNKPSHPTTSTYGMDLSEDPGTQLREHLGLPIMTGTSGSASDVIRSYRFTQDALSKVIPDGQFMSAHENRNTLHDLTFNWMRMGAPMEGVRGLISKHQTENNFRKISVPLPTATQTHTYPEIVSGIDLTLDGNTSENLKSSTERAQSKMMQHR
jgi:hypothetical protein